MSILSDRDIRRLCVRPTHVVESGWSEKADLISAPFTAREEELIKYSETVREYGLLVGGDQAILRPVNEDDLQNWNPMISPFTSSSIKEVEYKALNGEDGERSKRRVLSYGLSSYGYDVSLTDDIKLFTDINASILDPKKFDKRAYVTAEIHVDEADGSKYIIMPPHSFILGVTREYFHIPRDVLVIAVGKSTYARIGLIVNVTPLEPEWHGNVVIEVSNTTNLPAKVYINEGIAQFLFFKAQNVCEVSYGDRSGKYQGQTGVTPSKV